MTQSAKRRVWTVLLIALAATTSKALVDYLFEDFKGEGTTYSWSVNEARTRGLLVTELVAELSELGIPSGRVRFGRAWIEEEALSTSSFVWIPAERRTGGYRISFGLAEVHGPDESSLFFVPGDEGASTGMMSSGGKTLYYWSVNSPDISELRLSAVQSWKEPRAKNVRFAPKR